MLLSKRMGCLILVGSLVAAFGCSPDFEWPEKDGGDGAVEEDCEGHTGLVGSCCLTNAGCAGELVCITEEMFPFFGGLCTLDCSEDYRCPEGSLCIRLSVSGYGDIGYGCFVRCESQDATCGRPDYGCRQVGDSEVHICYPQQQ